MDLNRRSVLKGAAGIAGSATIGGAAVVGLTGSAVGANLSISDPSVVTTDDGQIQYVNVQVDHTATWDGFDVPVDAVAYWDQLTLRPNNEAVTHVVYDNRDAPVQLTNFSSQGSGSDGWGGPGEYVSNIGSPSDQHYKESGQVNADIDWNVIVDPRYASAKSVEMPYDIDGTSVLEPATDGQRRDSTIRYTKRLYFYQVDSEGTVTADDGSTTLSKLGSQDGTEEYAEAVGEFTLSVQNQSSSGDGSGGGSASAG